MERVPAQISMVVLNARSVGALRDFYRAVGWEERPGASDQLAMFGLGGVVLTLHLAPTDQIRSSESPATTLVINLDRQEEVDEAMEIAIRAGGTVVSPPTDQPWGGRSAVFADPEGNRWELLWVPRPR